MSCFGFGVLLWIRAFISPIAPSDFASEKGHSQLPFLDMLICYKSRDAISSSDSFYVLKIRSQYNQRDRSNGKHRNPPGCL